VKANALFAKLAAHGSRELKIQVGKRVYEVSDLLPVDPHNTADAFLAVAKIKKPRVPKEKQVSKIVLSVEVEVEKVTKKEKDKLVAAGTADNDAALSTAKAMAFLNKAKMRGCKVLSMQ
jgi:hypothetical protein